MSDNNFKTLVSETQNQEDERWMAAAMNLAYTAYENGEVPIGCLIVKDGAIIGRGYNQVEMLQDATAHAEILAIGSAAGKLENWRLEQATLYVTLEPCPMCAGAILNARVARVVFASPDSRFGACGTRSDVLTGNALSRIVEVRGGVLAEESLVLIRRFFQEMRAKKGDSGKKPENLLKN